MAAGDQPYDLNGILAQLFRVGPTEDEKRSAAAQALTRAGLGILAANQPSRLPKNAAGIAAQGIGGGLDTYQSQIDKQQAERKANAGLALQGLAMKKQMGQMDAMQGLLSESSPRPLAPQALAAGAAQGDIGPTVGNAARLQAMQSNPVASTYTPITPDKLARAAVAGVDIKPFLSLNAEARPDVMQIDAGPEVILQDKKTMRELGRIKKSAAPGSMPFEASDQSPGQYRDFLLNKASNNASRNITNVNAFTPASEEAQRDFIKSTRATYDALKQAPVVLDSIEKAKALIPEARGFMGPGGESMLEAAKFLNNRLGMSINVEGVNSAEELRTRVFVNIMDNLKKMDAQPSEMQQRLMMDALGKLGTDPNALPRVLDAFGDVIKGKVDLHNKEVQSAITRNVKFPYDPVIQLPTAPKVAPGGAPTNFRKPSSQAIDRLRMRPAEREQFEAIFGPGSADQYLGIR